MIYKEVYTIWLREIKKALADKWQLIISIGWPLFLIFVLGIGIDSFIDTSNMEVSYTELLGPGIIVIFVMGGSMSIGNSIIEDKKGFIKELLVAPISRSSIFIGKVLGEMTINLGTTLIAIIIFLYFIKLLTLNSALMSLLFIILIAFGFYGFGIVLSSLFKKNKSYQIISGLLVAAMVFLSGAFFPIENLPFIFKIFVLINPLTYGVDGLRTILVGFGEFGLFIDFFVLSGFAIIMLILGSCLFKKSLEK